MSPRMWGKRNEAQGSALCTCFTHTVCRECGLVHKAASGLTSKDPQGDFGLGTTPLAGFRGGPVARLEPRLTPRAQGALWMRSLAFHGLSVRTW